MHRRRALTFGIVGMMAGSLVLTGCDSLPNPFGGNASSDAPESPLGTYLSALWEGEAMEDSDYEAEFVAIEELVAACMVQQGFEYQPQQPYQDWGLSEEIEYEGPDWGSREFAEQYGYGIVEWPGMDMNMSLPEEPDMFVDPNADYVEGLSPSEQQAFYDALYGPSPSEEQMLEMEESGNWEWNPENRGCYGEAEDEVRGLDQQGEVGSDNYWDDPEFADLMANLETLYTDIEQSPTVTGLNQSWSTCMSDAGYPGYDTRFSVQEPLYEEWNALHEANMSGEWVEPSEDAMQTFQTKEIELAVQDWKCQDSVDFDEEYQRIVVEIEEAFIEQHKERLDALITQYGTQQ